MSFFLFSIDDNSLKDDNVPIYHAEEQIKAKMHVKIVIDAVAVSVHSPRSLFLEQNNNIRSLHHFLSNGNSRSFI